MKRIILTFCFVLPLPAVEIKPIEGATPEKLLGGTDNLKIVTEAKKVIVYRVAKDTGQAEDRRTVAMDGFLKSDASNTVSGPEQQKVLAVLSDATNFGMAKKGPFAKPLVSPDVIMRFKTGAGTVDIIIGFKFAEMAVCRDGKTITRRFDKIALWKNNFSKEASAAFIALAKKAFPEDPEIKAF